jgi:hypothetical protein
MLKSNERIELKKAKKAGILKNKHFLQAFLAIF